MHSLPGLTLSLLPSGKGLEGQLLVRDTGLRIATNLFSEEVASRGVPVLRTVRGESLADRRSSDGGRSGQGRSEGHCEDGVGMDWYVLMEDWERIE